MKCKSALMAPTLAVNSLLNGNQRMNKFVSVLVLGSALALSACGGDSDSSGSYDPAAGLPSCNTSGNTIIVTQFGQGCSVTKPDLNDGNRFGISCEQKYSNGQTIESYEVTTRVDGDPDSVIDDINSYNSGYDYVCKSLIPPTGL